MGHTTNLNWLARFLGSTVLETSHFSLNHDYERLDKCIARLFDQTPRLQIAVGLEISLKIVTLIQLVHVFTMVQVNISKCHICVPFVANSCFWSIFQVCRILSKIFSGLCLVMSKWAKDGHIFSLNNGQMSNWLIWFEHQPDLVWATALWPLCKSPQYLLEVITMFACNVAISGGPGFWWCFNREKTLNKGGSQL